MHKNPCQNSTRSRNKTASKNQNALTWTKIPSRLWNTNEWGIISSSSFLGLYALSRETIFGASSFHGRTLSRRITLKVSPRLWKTGATRVSSNLSGVGERVNANCIWLERMTMIFGKTSRPLQIVHCLQLLSWCQKIRGDVAEDRVSDEPTKNNEFEIRWTRMS